MQSDALRVLRTTAQRGLGPVGVRTSRSPLPQLKPTALYATVIRNSCVPHHTHHSRVSKSHSNPNSLSQRANIRTCPAHVRACLRPSAHASAHVHICPRPDSYTHLDSCSLHPRSHLECAKDQLPPRNLTPNLACLRISARKADACTSRV